MCAKKYKTIVVDPPWPVKKIVRKVRPNQKQNLDYPTMSLDAIKTLPISALSAENSVLFLWTTHAFLPSSFDIMSAWGFRYQRTLTWDKRNGMCLFGFHHRTEFCLFGYKGKLEMYPRRKAIPTCFVVKSERHSAKPDEFYDIVSVFGSPMIDVFARKERGGWDVWGNEVPCSIELGAQNIKESGKTAYNRKRSK
jgi:N6-adenosine-specific RNA methylase IME4